MTTITRILIGLLPLALHAVALLAAGTLATLLTPAAGPLALAPAAALYPPALFLAAGGTARLALRHIRPGRFPRDPATAAYRGRMVYGAAWTTIYYCKPLLHLAWSLPPCKALVLRLFGYRGSLDVTLYPDTWIRDLCLLDFGPGTYVANRATLGTNLVRSDGQIVVAPIRTGRDVVIGHLAMVGGGSRIGDGSEVGVAAKVGFQVRLGKGVAVGTEATVDSCSRIGDGVAIGSRAYVGKGCVVAAGLRIPAAAVIPDRSVLRSAACVQAAMASTVAAPALRRSA